MKKVIQKVLTTKTGRGAASLTAFALTVGVAGRNWTP